MSMTISCTWAGQSTDQRLHECWFTTIRLLIWMAVACVEWQRPQECATPCTPPCLWS